MFESVTSLKEQIKQLELSLRLALQQNNGSSTSGNTLYIYNM